MKQARRSEVTMEIMVGAFMFVVLLVLATFSIVLGSSKLFEESYDLTVKFSDIGGLKEGEHVIMRGVKIGNVHEIEVPEQGKGVAVTMQLDREVYLYDDYRFEVEASSMLGGMRISIYEGSEGQQMKAALRPDLVGLPHQDLLREAGRSIQSINEMLEKITNGGVLDDIDATMANLRETTFALNNGTGTVARLIHDGRLYNEALELVNGLDGASTNIVAMTESMRRIVGNIEEGKGTIGRLLSEDDKIYSELETAMKNIREASENLNTMLARLESGEGTVGKLLSEDDQLYQDLASTVASLKKVSENLAEPNGTVGKLIHEDDLYNKVIGVVDEAKATLDDFRETSPITTFSSIFFGAF